jgi:hypothetical protein
MRRKLLSNAAVLALPMAVVAVFPYGALNFKAAAVSQRARPSAAFVTLSEEEELRATAAVKAAWQGDGGGLRLIRADLTVGELPEEPPGAVLEFSHCALRTPESKVPAEAPPFPPSMRAAAPEKIASLPVEAARPVFSREELLKID